MSIIEIFNNIKSAVQAQWRRLMKPKIEVAVEASEPPTDTAPKNANRPKKVKEPEIEDADATHGIFTHFDDLLDKMDSYFKYLKMLRRDDPEAFDLYSKIGGQIMGSKTMFKTDRVDAEWMKVRPAFGMAHFINFDNEYCGEEVPSVNPKLLYFQKVKWNHMIQRTSNEIYKITLYYVDTRNPKFRRPFEWHVELLEDGTCRALKERTVHYMHIGKRNRESFAQWRWVLPDSLMNLFIDHKTQNKDVHDLSSCIFAMLANGCWNASAGIRINAKRNGLMGVFNIPMKRTAYFFKDRERVTNANGKTARIFHVTRPHKRILPDGREINVKMHFKGLRHFDWLGYSINITVPGLHHADINTFSSPVEVFHDGSNELEGTVDMATMGKMLADHIAQKSVRAA